MAAPTSESERIVALDVLRGLGVLGILVMNIRAFCAPDAAYSNPTIMAWSGWYNDVIWWMDHLFFDMKFMTIFSLLFGAGVMLFTRRKEEKGEPAKKYHFRRMRWLLVFGLIHGFLLWYGDILVWYAISGFILWRFRNKSATAQIRAGIITLAIGGVIVLTFALLIPHLPEGTRQNLLYDSWRPPQSEIDEQITTFQNGYMGQVAHRIPNVLVMNTLLYILGGWWRAGGIMLIGMGLFQLGVLTGERSSRFYRGMVLAGCYVGLPVIVVAAVFNARSGWSADYAATFGMLPNYYASLLVAGGWIGAAILVVQSGKMGGLLARLSAVGRMAFSNYIAHTLICTTIFYGYGFGLYGRVDPLGQALVVLAVWIVQLVLSPIWLRHFRFGPLEWLWRALTYRERPAMRVEVAPGSPTGTYS